jgi:uncharacterized protein YndB with AHSA1/START domain
MIRKSILVACPPDQAFRLFTARIHEWWPEDRRHLPDSRLSLTEDEGLRERASDGRQAELGRVRLWDPPRRLLLAFHVGSDAAHPTDLEVLFQPDAEGTRVCINHQAGPASVDVWTRRAALFERSWAVVLEALAAVDLGNT